LMETAGGVPSDLTAGQVPFPADRRG